MKKFIYFLGWLFNTKKWDAWTIRMWSYLLIAVAVYFVTDVFLYASLTFLTFQMGDMLFGVFVIKYEQYQREQDKIFAELSHKD